MKSMFDDISDKILDSDYGLIMPDYTLNEVDSVLRNIYGLETTNTQLDPFTVDFNEKDRAAPKEKVIRKPKIEQEEKQSENYEDYEPTAMLGMLSEFQREAGLAPKDKTNNSLSVSIMNR